MKSDQRYFITRDYIQLVKMPTYHGININNLKGLYYYDLLKYDQSYLHYTGLNSISKVDYLLRD